MSANNSNNKTTTNASASNNLATVEDFLKVLDNYPPDHPNGPCQKKACAIQTCLDQNDYNQKRCKNVIREYNACLKMFKKAQELRRKQQQQQQQNDAAEKSDG